MPCGDTYSIFQKRTNIQTNPMSDIIKYHPTTQDLAHHMPELCLAARQRDQEFLLRNGTYECLYSKGEVIFSPENRTKSIYFLVEGKVKYVQESRKDIVTTIITPGQFFGLHPYFSAKKEAQLSAVAFEYAKVYEIQGEVLEELLESNPKVGRYLLDALSDELDRTEERATTLLQKQTRARLCDTLLMLAKLYGYESDRRTIAVNMRRDELARLCNINLSNTSRTLTTLAGEKVVALNKKKIKILRMETLKRISDELE